MTVKQLDAASLRALAHPLRMRILARLRRHGPATASMLAEVLGESSGATSYHLRALARQDFVEEEPGRGTARERWWRATHEMTSWREGTLADDPETRAAEEWLLGFHARHVTAALDSWLARRSAADPAWVEAAEQSDFWLEMTPAEVRALMAELVDVVMRHRERLGRRTAGEPEAPQEPEAPGRPDGAAPVRVFLVAVPEVGDGSWPD